MKSARILLLLLASIAKYTLAGEQIDREKFFESCALIIDQKPVFVHEGASYWLRKEPVLGGRGKKTINSIFSYVESSWGKIDNRKLAYILGTAYRESRETMTPIREGKCENDGCVIRAIDKLIKAKPQKYKNNYALPASNGKSYYGRGLSQITLEDNYSYIGKSIGLGSRLHEDPDIALHLDVAVKILVEGMDKGHFTRGRHNLDRYFNEHATDWINARRIINGGSMDNAPITGWYAERFMGCLTGNIDFR